MITVNASEVPLQEQPAGQNESEFAGVALRDIASCSNYISKIKAATQTAILIRENQLLKTKLFFDKKMLQFSKRTKNLKHIFPA